MNPGMSAKASPREQKEHDEYRAKDDARTLTDAEGIHADPKRLDGAHRHLKLAKDALHRTLKRVGKRKASRS
jgi:hypothetical protein